MEFNKEELDLIKKALDFYMRIGIGQMYVIKDHPTFVSVLSDRMTENQPDNMFSSEYHTIRKEADEVFTLGRNKLINEVFTSKDASYGIYNDKVDESCRDALKLIKRIEEQQL